jgi:NAD(P)-dependent dehydrogenase (short-subunit alcohol dehydrogenase family)
MMTRDKLAAAVGFAVGATLVTRRIVRARRAIDFRDRVALITGGSRGLGLLIARELGRRGAIVVLAARDQQELERAQKDLEAQGVTASVLAADITLESDAQRIVEETIDRHGRLDVLVNNAGVITVGPHEHMTAADFREAMDTHFWGPFHATQAAIDHMRTAGGGRIANISSIGGRIGVPHLVPYCASKFALTGFSTAIGPELARDNIVMTTVCPGLMRTGSPFNAWFKGQHREEFAWFAIADSLPLLSIDARRAAAQVVDAIRYGDAELVITWPAKLAIAAAAIMPNTVAAAMQVTNRMLPGPSEQAGVERRSGWQSTSKWAPSPLTRTSERSAAANNEVQPIPAPGH